MNNLDKWNDINAWRITLAQKEAAKGLDVTDNTSLPDLITQVDNLDKRNLQSKEVIPIKQDQLITADLTYTGLSDVNVKAIPDQYKDTTTTNATANNILVGKKAAINSLENGGIITGTIPIYDGNIIITPTDQEQTLDTHNKYNENNIIINSIPSNYKNTNNTNITANDILEGKIGINTEGEVIGTISTYNEITNITPTTFLQELNTSGKYNENNIIINAVDSTIDNNITAENIKKDVSILGVIGIFEGGSNKLAQVVDKTVTTITAEDLEGATKIGDYSFYNCINLTSVIIPQGIISIGIRAFNGCVDLISSTLPQGLELLDDYAFYRCTNLTSITIPNSVTSIEGDAFSSCTNLASVTFEVDSLLLFIGSNVFYNCKNLTNITIPNSVTSIGAGCFTSCSKLATVSMLPVTPPTAGINFFSDTPALTRIEVPSASLTAYQTATNWSAKASLMVGV